MRKYVLAIAAIALLFAACTNDEVLNQPIENGTEIGFRSIDGEKSSSSLRASVTTGNTITSFTVTGWWDKEYRADPSKPATNYGGTEEKGVYLFNAFNIARGENGSTPWAYTPKRFWPAATKGVVDFYAYSPASSLNLVEGIKDYRGGSIKYTVPTINDATTNPNNLPQEDFLVAKVLGQNEGTVELNFLHALSRVTFSARKNNPDITYIVKEVKLVNLASTATLDLKKEEIPVAGNFDYTGGELVIWTGHTTNASYGVDMGQSPIFLQYSPDDDPEYYSLLGDINGLMVMPQKTTAYTGITGKETPGSNQFAIAVTYKAYQGTFYYAGDKDGANEYVTRYFPVKKGSDPLTFEIGRQYNFFLTFGDEAADAIRFEVSVSEWAADMGIIISNLTDYRQFLSPLLQSLIPNDSEGKITYKELKAMTSLTLANGTNAADLWGLEYLFNLKSIFIGNSPSSFTGTLKLSNTHTSLTTIEVYSYGSMGGLDITELPANEVTIRTIAGSHYTISTLKMRENQKLIFDGEIRFTDPPFLSNKINAAVLTGSGDGYANLTATALSFTSAVTSNDDLKGLDYLTSITSISFPQGVSDTDLILTSANASLARFNFTGTSSVGTLDVSALPATTITIDVQTSLSIGTLIHNSDQTITYYTAGSEDKTNIGTTVVK